jgi:hypothetical protein
VSILIGLAVTVVVAEVATTGHLLTVSLFPLYTTVCAMLVAHRDAIHQISSAGATARKRGAIGGGVGAFTLGFLLQTSIPAGAAIEDKRVAYHFARCEFLVGRVPERGLTCKEELEPVLLESTKSGHLPIWCV